MKLRSANDSGLKVAVLMGGVGEERKISLQSGGCVAEALKQAGLNVITADVGPDNLSVLEDLSIDVFFIALHGRFGEDGQLQQILEEKSLTYTGSGPQASRLAFDKWAGKERFADVGASVPRAIKFDPQIAQQELVRQLAQLGNRFVVKPLRQGSTIGVRIVHDADLVHAAAKLCASHFGDCMIEQFIPGREITVGILEHQALPIIEISTRAGFYDFEAKYLDDHTQFLFETIGDVRLAERIEAAALACFDALGCRHFARVDMILGEDEKPYVLEVNTIPGFTDHSLLPMAGARVGMSMSELCKRIVELAVEARDSVGCLSNAEIGGGKTSDR